MQTKKPGRDSEWLDADDAPRLMKPGLIAPTSIGDALVRRVRPKSESPREAVNLRLDADVLQFFRAAGPGWQTRINEALRKAAGLSMSARCNLFETLVIASAAKRSTHRGRRMDCFASGSQ